MRAVMIMFDTLTRDFLPNYGNEWVKAPNFERLREQTTTFDNFYGGSMPCMPARRELHTGRYNFLHRGWGPLEPFDQSVFDILQQNGVYSHLVTDHSHYFEDGGATYHNRYSTWESHRGQEGDRWVPRAFGKKMKRNQNTHNKEGISVDQHYANRTRMMDESEMSSVKTIQSGLDFLEEYKDKDRWFLQIECFDPHEPFYVPEKYRELYGVDHLEDTLFWPKYGKIPEDMDEEEIIQARREYAALLSMCDAHLGKVLDFFDQHEMWEDTLIIINTDHGFLLGEHDWLGKNIAPMYEELIHLPFFMHVPGSQFDGQQCAALCQTVDLPATLLDYFEIDYEWDIEGKSLLPALATNKNHEDILFGVNGGQVNLFDGRYVYMRASQKPDNGKMTAQTLSFTQARGFFPMSILGEMVQRSGSRFTNGCPFIELSYPNPFDSYSLGNLLFDLVNDPHQKQVLDDPELEQCMVDKLKKRLAPLEIPENEYERLGL